MAPMKVPLKVVAMAFGLYAPPMTPVHIDAPAASRVPNGGFPDVTVGELLEEFRPAPDQLDACITRERLAAVRAAVATLPGAQKTVIELRLDGLTLEEIGGRIGRSRERARQLERDALRNLRAALAHHGATGSLSIAQNDHRNCF